MTGALIAAAVGLPLLVGLVALALPEARHARLTLVATLTALASLVLLALAWATGDVLDVPWLPALGLRLHLALDGISGPLAVLAAAVTAGAALAARRRPVDGGRSATFVACLLITLGGALAAFAARDALLFVVAFETVLVPVWVLITRFGDAHDPAARREAGMRFVLYTGLGSTLLLLGVLALITAAGTADLELLAARGGDLDLITQTVVAALLTAGLAVKVPLWPLHSWLPAAHTTAPTAGSVLLAAVLLKLGTYGLVRLPLATVPDGFARLAPALAVLAVIGIVWGGLVCLRERDLKRLVAWSSIAHMGFVVLGLASGTETGVVAALYGNLAHGVISALLFVLVGGLKARRGDDDLALPWPALREVAPRTGLLLMVGLAASLGLPGLAGFWGEMGALVAAWRPAPDRPEGVFVAAVVVAALGAALAAAYALRVARIVWWGEPDSGASEHLHTTTAAADGGDGARPGASEHLHPGHDLHPAHHLHPDGELDRDELVPATVLALAVVVLGVAPGLVLAVTDPAVATLMGGGAG